jgi:hypothetical protein
VSAKVSAKIGRANIPFSRSPAAECSRHYVLGIHLFGLHAPRGRGKQDGRGASLDLKCYTALMRSFSAFFAF